MIDAAGLAPAPPPAPKAPPPPPGPNMDKAMALMLTRLAEPPPPAQPAAAPSITIHQGDTHIAPAAVTVQPAAITVENRQEAQAAPNVEVRVEAIMPEQPAPTVEVTVEQPAEMTMHVASMPNRRTTSGVERNLAGEIIKTEQIETDA